MYLLRKGRFPISKLFYHRFMRAVITFFTRIQVNKARENINKI